MICHIYIMILKNLVKFNDFDKNCENHHHHFLFLRKSLFFPQLISRAWNISGLKKSPMSPDRLHYIKTIFIWYLFVYFIFLSCSSFVGKVDSKVGQGINLGPECFSYGSALHEIGHVVGFWHEHTRYDRDNFLKIFPQNIQTGRKESYFYTKFHQFSNTYLIKDIVFWQYF